MNCIIRIVSGNEKLTLAPYTVCRPLDGGICGFEAPPEIKGNLAESAFVDGGTLTGSRFAPRELTVTFEVTDKALYRETRDKILRLVGKRAKTEITADLFGRRRSVTGYPMGKAEFKRGNTHDYPIVTLRYVCPDPFFTENKTKRLSLPASVGLLTFPLNFMGDAGTVASFTDGGFSHCIHNPGDVSCGFRITVTAVGGDVTDPAILLNGKRLQLMETLKIGDVAVFDTRRGNCGISVNGVLRYNFLRQSEFFMLEPGDNRVTVMSTGNSANLSAEVELMPLYAGA